MAIILDGKKMAAALAEEQKARVNALRARGVGVGLAVVLAGEDPASQIYVRNKEAACHALGVFSQTVRLPQAVSQQELEAVLRALCQDARFDGVLLQLPLPGHLDAAAALQCIPPEKDVDGFHPVNAGRLLAGEPCTIPCTPKGVLHMLKQAGVPLAGKDAVVVGRSNIVGKPMALLLLQENCTVTLCHSRTENLAAHTRQADILVAAVGKPGFITADMVKPGAAVIDVGINRTAAGLRGDVDFEAVAPVAGWISPVPGGVGKMTIGMLMENTIQAAERKAR